MAEMNDKAPAITRRGLCMGGAGAAVLLACGGVRYAGHEALIRPPGGQDDSATVLSCIRCQKCVEACPRKVIMPAHAEDGILGMRVPTLNFDTNHCDFCQEENGGTPLCEAVCPTGALDLPEGATADNTIIGHAEIDTYTCLAYRNTGCKECYDACAEVKRDAIELESGRFPKIKTELCNGCGACEAACISMKAGSIVEGATERACKIRYISQDTQGA